MSDLAAVGAVHWLEHNRKQARKYGVPAQDVTLNVLRLHDFRRKTHLTLSELEVYGRLARDRGYLRKRHERVYEYMDGREILVLRNKKEGWEKIDGTLPQRDSDTTRRICVGPQWEKNSCAVDVVLWCAILFDFGRLQIDQMTFNAWHGLPPPTQVLQAIVRRRWGLLTPGKRETLRNELRRTLEDYNPDTFNPGGRGDDQLPVSEVMDACFNGYQNTMTVASVIRCCDESPRHSATHPPSRIHSLYIAQLPVQVGLQHYFDARPHSIDAHECPHKDKCVKRHTSQHTVVDRIAPTLIVHVPELQQSSRDAAAADPAVFDDVTITYATTQGNQTCTYHVVSSIITTGRKAGTHFVGVFRDPVGRFFLFDSLKNEGRVKQCKSWLDTKLRYSRATVLFFRPGPFSAKKDCPC